MGSKYFYSVGIDERIYLQIQKDLDGQVFFLTIFSLPDERREKKDLRRISSRISSSYLYIYLKCNLNCCVDFSLYHFCIVFLLLSIQAVGQERALTC